MQRCEAIDLGRRAYMRSIRASGWPRGDETGSPANHAPLWVTRAARDRPRSDKDPKLKGKAGTGRMWSWSADRREAGVREVPSTLLRP
jgi:hypothetical protein